MLQTLSQQELYTEAEAAGVLKIAIGRLHFLLDRNVFTDGKRPANLLFRPSDLLLLEIWARTTEPAKVLEMPHR